MHPWQTSLEERGFVLASPDLQTLRAWSRVGPAFVTVTVEGVSDPRQLNLGCRAPVTDLKLYVQEKRRSLLRRLVGANAETDDRPPAFEDRFVVRSSDPEMLTRLEETTRLRELAEIPCRIDLRVGERRDDETLAATLELSLTATADLYDALDALDIFIDVAQPLCELPDDTESLLDLLEGLPPQIWSEVPSWDPEAWQREIVVKLFWSSGTDLRAEIARRLPTDQGVFTQIARDLHSDSPARRVHGPPMAEDLIECLGRYVVSGETELYNHASELLRECPHGDELLERFECYVQGQATDHYGDLEPGERAAFVYALLLVVEDGLPFLAVHAAEALAEIGAMQAIPWLHELTQRLPSDRRDDASRIQHAAATLQRLRDLPRGADPPEDALPRAPHGLPDDTDLPQPTDPDD